MSAVHGEYRVRAHPELPDKVLITWRADGAALWIHVATVNDLNDASPAMVHHRDKGTA